MIMWVLPPPSDSGKAFEGISLSSMKCSEYGYTEPAFSTKQVTAFDKWIQSDLSWKAQPLFLRSRACKLSGCQRETATSWGIFGVQVCSLPPFGVTESLPGYHWSQKITSYLLVPETPHSSSNPCSFWQYTSRQSPDILAGSLLRCPLQQFMDSPLSLVKIIFVKITFFFPWIQDKSQWPLLLRDQELTTILEPADLLVTFYLCELALCLW